MGIFIDDDDIEFDVSRRSEHDLQELITAEIENEKSSGITKTPISEELRKQKILSAESNRVQSRVLFITNDVAVREPNSAPQLALLDLKDVFAEIHIVLLGNFKTTDQSISTRLAKNVWLYEANSKYLFLRPFVARKLVSQQLVFTDGFRPDMIVALEPFEAAIAAWLLARKYDRPWQVHIKNEKYFESEAFVAAGKGNNWRLRMMQFILRRVASVRVSTETALEKVTDTYKNVKDVAVLPKYFNISQLLALSPPTTDKFPQFRFTILYKGKLDADSTFYRTLDAARVLLTTPSIGLVVLGNGPLKSQFMERAKILGVDSQLLWLGDFSDPIEVMQSVDVMMITDTDDASDDMAITAAALGVPMIAAETELKKDLFESGRDAFIIAPEDTKGFADALRSFINTNSLRIQFRENAQTVVQSRIEEDPRLYQIALRNSIEKILYLEEEANENKKQAAVIEEAHKEASQRSKQFSTVDGVEMKLPKQQVEE